MAKFFWRNSKIETGLQTMLSVLSEEYPLAADNGDKELIFRRSDMPGVLNVTDNGTAITIEYGALNCAARGVGMALSGLTTSDKTVFSTLGIMLDCSRNAVMTVPHLKKWFRRLALM